MTGPVSISSPRIDPRARARARARSMRPRTRGSGTYSNRAPAPVLVLVFARARERQRPRARGSAARAIRQLVRARVPQVRARAPSAARACSRGSRSAPPLLPPPSHLRVTQVRACAVPSARRGPERERDLVSCVFPQVRARGVSALHAAYAAAAVVAAAGARAATRQIQGSLALHLGLAGVAW